MTVQRDLLGQELLRYEGSEIAIAELTPEVTELLAVALSVHGRSAIPARSPQGGACTLLVIGNQDGRTCVCFHACTAHECGAEYRCQGEAPGGTGILKHRGVHESPTPRA